MFFCTNQKEGGKKCCGSDKSKELYRYAKDKCRDENKLGKGKIGVSEAKCLGRCDLGPSCVSYPDQKWHRYTCEADIDEILKGL